jgi:HD-GYP domain-containing protein (c-di-GMP phosphodiesterase class II)
MERGISVNLMSLLLSLSEALDLANLQHPRHHLRTAYIAQEIASAAGMPQHLSEQLFIAALLHDIGALTAENEAEFQKEEVMYHERHCLIGEMFIKRVPLFATSAQIVKNHHTFWREWTESIDTPKVVQAQILLLADTLEKATDYNKYILHQDQHLLSYINSMSGTVLHPSIVDLLKSIASRESFWLDLVSPKVYSNLLNHGPFRGVVIDLNYLRPISELFRNLVDFRSRFTVVHSSGVAGCAAAIARLAGMTETEITLMEIAGNFHDLGKITVPNTLINKNSQLTSEEAAIMRSHTYYTYYILSTINGIQHIAEWAAYHHERLDGSGYPFHVDARQISVGSRIMAVSDTIAALTESRPYRSAMKSTDVISTLKEMGNKNYLDKNIIRLVEENYDEVQDARTRQQFEVRKVYEQDFATK